MVVEYNIRLSGKTQMRGMCSESGAMYWAVSAIHTALAELAEGKDGDTVTATVKLERVQR